MYTLYSAPSSRPVVSRRGVWIRRHVLAWLGLTCSVWDHQAGRWMVLRGAVQPAEGPYAPGGWADKAPQSEGFRDGLRAAEEDCH